MDMRMRVRTLTTALVLVLAAGLGSAAPAFAAGRDEILAFTSYRQATGFDVWKMRGDGRALRRLTHGSRSEVSPTFSPDGRWIAFVRQHPFGEPSTLWLMRPDGSEKHRIASDASGWAQLAWSPEGDEIVYVGSDSGAQTDLFVVDVSDGVVRRLTDTPLMNEREPDWAPDGTLIAYAAAPLSGVNLQGTYDIFTVDVAGTAPVQLTEHERNDNRPKWSPDSSLIAFRSARDDTCEGCEEDYTSNIYVMNADGSEERRVSNVEHSRTDRAEWSPDGKYLYLPVAYDDDAYLGPDGDAGIYSVRNDGSELTNLTNNGRDEVTPILSPDGGRLYFIRFAEEHRIMRMNLSNKRTQVIRNLRSAYPLGDVGPK